MKTLTILSGLLLSAFGAWMSSAPEQAAPAAPVHAATPMIAKAGQKAVPPAGFPFQLKVHFKSTAGEMIDTVAEYGGLIALKPDGLFAGDWRNGEEYMFWVSPRVNRTIDHPALDNPPMQFGPRLVNWPIEVIFYPRVGAWVLRIGTGSAYIDARASQRSPTDFDIPFPERFDSRSIRFFDVRVGP